jgi:hypothetical protein
MGHLRTDNVSQERLAEKAASLGLRSSDEAKAVGREVEQRREQERKATLARAERRASSTEGGREGG